MSSESLTSYKVQVRANRLGLWLFFVSESFMFGGLLAARFYLWGNTRPELDHVVPQNATGVKYHRVRGFFPLDPQPEFPLSDLPPQDLKPIPPYFSAPDEQCFRKRFLEAT